jgi:hypothetical protein
MEGKELRLLFKHRYREVFYVSEGHRKPETYMREMMQSIISVHHLLL